MWSAAKEAAILFAADWGFSVEELKLPVAIFQGDADVNVPLSHSQYLADRIPNSTLKVYPGLGHFSLLCSRAEEYMRVAVERASS